MSLNLQNMDMALTLEISAGCVYSCTGCTIQREASTFPSDTDFQRLERLVEDMQANGVYLSDFTIGPTDILSSYNGPQILSDGRIKALAQQFSNPNINVSLLTRQDEAYRELGRKLNWLFAGGTLALSIPFEVRQINNRKYLDVLRRRIKLIEAELTQVEIEVIYPIVNFQAAITYDRVNKTSLTERLLLNALDIELHERTHMDVILPHGRRGLRNSENAQELVRSIDHLNQLYYNIMTEPEYADHSIGINELHPNEGRLWDVVYFQGNLFIIPFILDGFPVFDPEYRLKNEWSFAGIYEHANSKFLRDLKLAATVEDCRSCEFIADCAARGMIGIMDVTNTHRCLSVIRRLRHHFMWVERDRPITH